MPDALLTLPAAAIQLAISRRTLEREIASARIAACAAACSLGHGASGRSRSVWIA